MDSLRTWIFLTRYFSGCFRKYPYDSAYTLDALLLACSAFTPITFSVSFNKLRTLVSSFLLS